jgi:hypothetical protein
MKQSERTSPPEGVQCPYPGTRPFTADDADHFYGREDEIAELISYLQRGDRDVIVIGPPGAGKSSLITGGVLPRLARRVPGLWPYTTRHVWPGEEPMTRLREELEVPDGKELVVSDRVAALLEHRAAGAFLLIIVDKLDDLFMLASRDERKGFLAAMRELRAEPRCAVVFALGAEFLGALMESDLWTDRNGVVPRVWLPTLSGEALRDAIAMPALAAGVTVEPALIEALIADGASRPGGLRFLQDTMVDLWNARSDQRLTLAAYKARKAQVVAGLPSARVISRRKG